MYPHKSLTFSTGPKGCHDLFTWAMWVVLVGSILTVFHLAGTALNCCRSFGGTKTALAPPTRPTKSMAFRGLWEISGVVKSVICFFRHLVVKVDGFPSSFLIVNAEKKSGLLGIVVHRLCHSNSFFISWIQVDIGSHDYWFAGKLAGRRRQAAC